MKEVEKGSAREAETGGLHPVPGDIVVGVVLSLRGTLTTGGDWFSRGSTQKPLGAETEKQH